jgi:tripartite-type tricarboxylate transporter receptor subunit TctC
VLVAADSPFKTVEDLVTGPIRTQQFNYVGHGSAAHRQARHGAAGADRRGARAPKGLGDRAVHPSPTRRVPIAQPRSVAGRQVRALAVTSAQRMADSNVPTLVEVFNCRPRAHAWFSLGGISAIVGPVQAVPDTKRPARTAAEAGASSRSAAREEFRSFIERDPKFDQLVRAAPGAGS